MSFLKRAWLYVTRKKGKSILLFVILLIMATFVLTGLSIQKASDAKEKDLRQSFGGTIKVEISYEDDNPYLKTTKVDDGVVFGTMRPITHEVIDTIMKIPGLKNYDANGGLLAYFSNATVIKGNIPVGNALENAGGATVTDNTQNNLYFRSGKLSLAEGKHLVRADVNAVLISKPFAEANGLTVGDKLDLNVNSKATVTIIGIYQINQKDSHEDQLTSYDKIENRIFLDVKSFQTLCQVTPPVETSEAFDYVTFQAEDPAEIDHILSLIKQIDSIDWRAYLVSTDNHIYENAVAPLMGLNKLVATLLIVIIAVSVVILSLILTLWTKSRVHETGVFLSAGIKKSAIIGQYLAEILLIAVLAFGLSFFTSNAVANQLSDQLLQQSKQTALSPEPQDSNENGISMATGDDDSAGNLSGIDIGGAGTDIGAGADDNIQNNTKIDVSIGAEAMLQLYLIGFAIIILSVGVSSGTVMRLKPCEILSKMS